MFFMPHALLIANSLLPIEAANALIQTSSEHP
jgi:hypothetical protein